MLEVSEKEIKKRLSFDNPWWDEGEGIDSETIGWPRRAYFKPFAELVTDMRIRRAVVLMGPRRVGKTVMIQHTVQHLLDEGTPAHNIFYVSIENPLFTGLSLEKLLNLYQDIHGHPQRSKGLFVFFDEIQYRKEWEVHLKSLVDSYPGIRFVVSGSAAAALKLKSRESGAGRFTDFLLPPLTFAEFLRFRKKEAALFDTDTDEWRMTKDIGRLNTEFLNYINFGGFPEPIMSAAIRGDMKRFVGNDIIDKVLLRDLPSLFGIPDSRELNQLFSVLTYNTGNEVNLDGLSKASGVAKNTLKKYLDYLEAAFLIHRVQRVDQNARRFKRIASFKVYLTNPSLRAALFGPVEADDEAMGMLAETAVVAQLVHTGIIDEIHYARWRDGEVDIVGVESDGGKPWLVTEVKWSDSVVNAPDRIKSLITFATKNNLLEASVLTRSIYEQKTIKGIKIDFAPVSEYAYHLGRAPEIALRDGFNPRTFKPFRA
jgi:predicted AAA+ superfamily ATPase